MGDLDRGAKVVLREDPDALLRLVRPDLPLRAIRLAPTEQIKLDRLMDSLVEAEYEGVGRCWLHFEFLAAWRAMSSLRGRGLTQFPRRSS